MGANGSRPRFPLGGLPFLVFLWLSRAVLPAQEGEEDYYLDQAGEEIRFIQRLSWEQDEYAYRYEVIIEREGEAGQFQEIFQTFATGERLELSLAPGKYRYGVRAWDLLDRPGNMPEWSYFEVLLARKPELRTLSPPQFFLDEETEWVLTLGGQNLDPGAEVYLRHPGTVEAAVIPRESSGSDDGSSLRLVFNERQFLPGAYEVYVRNPGGLETSKEGFTVTFHQGWDFLISGAYAPIVPLYGEFNRLLDQTLYPAGAASRAALFPWNGSFGSGGIELTVFWNYFHAPFPGYTISAQGMGILVSGVFQKWLPNRKMALGLRAGGGFTLLADYHFSYARGNSPPHNTILPQVGAGLFFFWKVKSPLFFELGLEFTHWFMEDPVSPSPSPGYLRPWLGIGWQL